MTPTSWVFDLFYFWSLTLTRLSQAIRIILAIEAHKTPVNPNPPQAHTPAKNVILTASTTGKPSSQTVAPFCIVVKRFANGVCKPPIHSKQSYVFQFCPVRTSMVSSRSRQDNETVGSFCIMSNAMAKTVPYLLPQKPLENTKQMDYVMTCKPRYETLPHRSYPDVKRKVNGMME